MAAFDIDVVSPRSPTVSLQPTAAGRSAPATADGIAEPAGTAPTRPAPVPEQRGAVRVTVRQSETGLIVQAFAHGGVTDEMIAGLRQRAHDLAMEYGQTLADLTINGTRIAVAPSRRIL
jgi:hypothetical protein